MMALGNVGPDAGLYYDRLSPHLDVPAFADWAGARLGCPGPRIDDAVGSPVPTTLRFTYNGPCAYAQAGSSAVQALAIQNGGHGWGCQDSDPSAPPHSCAGMPNPPGLDAAGRPKTGGLFLEAAFWNFVAHGVSSATPAPSLPSARPGTWAVLGDSYSSGAGVPPYLHGTNVKRDHCRRSTRAYASRSASALGFSRREVAFHACAGARVADLYGSNRRDHESRQLKWVTRSTRLVTLTVGWSDAGLPAAIAGCERKASRCQARWSRAVGAGIAALGRRSGPRSLSRLYRRIRAKAPGAKVVVLGYPQVFPSPAPRSCSFGRHRRLSSAAMTWLDSEVARLDAAIAAAALAAHVSYVDAWQAFAGHEACTAASDVTRSLNPNAAGLAALTAFVQQAA